MKSHLIRLLKVVVLVSLLLMLNAKKSTGQEELASIYPSPSQGSFESGTTFNISFFVNTGEHNISSIRLDLEFSPDKMQVVEPTAGNSFISVWVVQPEYSNTEGKVTLQGEIPSPGINTSAGLITTLTFRAKAPGEAVVSVAESSEVIADDGKGTNILTSYGHGRYLVNIPASAGPKIFSSTHSDQNKWYKDNNLDFNWETQIEGNIIKYSWDFNEDPRGIPDNEVDGQQTHISYEDIESGIWYFHVKAQVDGSWGQSSHYIVRIDKDPPLSFSPIVEPESAREGVPLEVRFETIDLHSGIDHYELRTESLTGQEENKTLFVEGTNPWQITSLSNGEYKVVVRAFDRGGNWYDGEATFTVQKDLSALFSRGSFGSLISWKGLIILVILAPLVFVVFTIYENGRRKQKKENVESRGKGLDDVFT